MKYQLISNLLLTLLFSLTSWRCSLENLDTNTDAVYLSALQRLGEGLIPGYIITPSSNATNISLTATTLSSSSIQLGWTTLTSAVNYRVYRSTAANFVPGSANEVVSTDSSVTLRHPRGTLVTPLGKQTTSAANISLTSGTRYYYRIGGISANGSITYSNEVSAVPQTSLTVRTHAGSGVSGSTDGSGYEAKFYFPQGLSVDAEGFIYLADAGNHRIRRISPRIGDIVTSGGVNYALEGLATTFAGVGTWGNANSSIPSSASFFEPWSTCVIGTTVYVADSANHAIRQITADGIVTTLAGANTASGGSGNTNGTGTAARFNFPQAITCGAAVIYVADTYNNAIRSVTTGGAVTTLAGTPAGSSGQSGQGSADGTGTAATFYLPRGIVFDGGTNLYVSDSGNHVIRQITTGGTVTTLAGTAGIQGKDDGTGANARFAFPRGITFSSGTNNIYVTDSANHLIRQITSAGVVTTVAGTGEKGGLDGLGIYASFWFPQGITYSAVGNACPCLYVSDTENHKIRRITGAL
ncbi:MAG: hypothetical protein IPL26_26770 [Leptospiraceae bacterium]|nr:hypothetical protein [Leptospiraceae bacterium]